MSNTKENPIRRKQGLAVQTLANEVLVYDLERHRAHCLNQPAAIVWRHCDGKTTIRQMTKILQEELDVNADQELVRYAIDRLTKAHLLEGSPAWAGYTRRDFMRRLKKLGLAASAMLPVVISIVSPAPASALSCVPNNGCAGMPDCTPCNNPGGNCGAGWKCCGGRCRSSGQAASCGC
jgi:Coenzyme PQQ synthesis protein D (PqqD)